MYTYKITRYEKEATQDGGAVLNCDIEFYKDKTLVGQVLAERFSEPSSIDQYAKNYIENLTSKEEKQVTKIDSFIANPIIEDTVGRIGIFRQKVDKLKSIRRGIDLGLLDQGSDTALLEEIRGEYKEEYISLL